MNNPEDVNNGIELTAEGVFENQFLEDTKGLLSRIPLEYLRAAAFSIRVADSINPYSWSLVANVPDWLSLLVGRYTTILVGPAGAEFIFRGNVDPEDYEALSGKNIYTGYPFEASYGRTGSPQSFSQLFAKYRERHVSQLEELAHSVKARGTWHWRHNQQAVDQIAAVIDEELPAPGYFGQDEPTDTKFWRYSLDRDVWPTERQSGFISSQRWPNPGVDLRELPQDQEAFLSAVRKLPDCGPESARRLWNLLHGMKEGDQLLAHQGQTIKAVGRVSGEYEYCPQEPWGAHRRPIAWEATPPAVMHFSKSPAATRAKSGWGTVPITAEDFSVLTGQNSTKPISAEIDVFSALVLAFHHAGLTYTASQIATFYTALQTKGFVVLSGISGTGKSKIAQHFTATLPGAEIRSGTGRGRVMANMLSFTMSTTQNWAAIPGLQADLFPPIDENVRQPVILDYDGNLSKGYVVLRTLAQGRPTLYLTLGRDLSDALRKVGTDRRFYASFELDDAARSVERVRIFGQPVFIDGGGGNEDPMPEITVKTNSLFLAVRPDWRDSTSLLGYYNPLTETYEWTEFLRFLLRAVDDYREHKKDALAWFVILDEMNLAHVEYYFADLLSIIESGRDSEGWSQEPIRLTYPDAKTDNPPPHEIHLPPNLYIIGTVNMDETTHAFSPKVLDRAFTIELTDVDFSDYPPATPATAAAAMGPGLPDEERQALLRAFTNNGTFAQIRKEDVRTAVDAHPEIRTWLQTLNTKLAEHQFHFGYRVFDEIAQFIYHADRNGMFDDWTSAFDHAVYMKVLPKFNGSHARLGGPLSVLIDWAKDPSKASGANIPDGLADGTTDDVRIAPAPRLTRVWSRAQRMNDLLEANGFVSFG